jgi:predicted nucleotidyltransferase
MNKIDALDRLRQSEQALRVRGVRHAALFGSVARGDERASSDIDILIEIDPAANMTAFDYAGLKNYIGGLFDRPVDVVNRDSLKAHIAASAAIDAIDAF